MSRFERFAKNGLMVFVLAMVTIGLPGCGGDDGDVPPVIPENPIALSGHVLKGSVAGATVNVRAISATGVVGAVIGGPFTTDGTGAGVVRCRVVLRVRTRLRRMAGHIRTSRRTARSTWSRRCGGS